MKAGRLSQLALFLAGVCLVNSERLCNEHESGCQSTLPILFRRSLAAPEDPCKIIEECSLCDAIARAEVAECGRTGRVERWLCEPILGEGDGQFEYLAAAYGHNVFRLSNPHVALCLIKKNPQITLRERALQSFIDLAIEQKPTMNF